MKLLILHFTFFIYMLKTISLTIHGKVQGVYFRQSTKDKAIRLNITGTVSNLPDGNVKVIATGTEEKLQELITWCHTGPRGADVIAVDVQQLPIAIFEKFLVVRNI